LSGSIDGTAFSTFTFSSRTLSPSVVEDRRIGS
jgi:hypothetical protein